MEEEKVQQVQQNTNIPTHYLLPQRNSVLWSKLKPLLQQKFESFEQYGYFLVQACKSTQKPLYHLKRKKFNSLQQAIREFEEYVQQPNLFMTDILPKIQQYALDSQTLFKSENYQIPYLLRNSGNHEFWLTQKQCASILALGFLECLENYHQQFEVQKKVSDSWSFKVGVLSFSELIDSSADDQPSVQRLLCQIYYFYEAFKKSLDKKVGFFRRKLQQDQVVDWENCNEICDPQVDVHIEGLEVPKDLYQVDFANKNLMIHSIIPSLTQEEVMFTIRPDCYISLLVSDTLQTSEAFLISGAQTYSQYTGYLETFKFAGTSPYINDYQASTIIAIDAYNSPGIHQFGKQLFERDLNKALVGFTGLKSDQHDDLTGILDSERISTGNWGCGIFGNDLHLKLVTQMMAAKVTNKTLDYSSFKNQKIMNDFQKTVNGIIDKKLTISQLYSLVLNYYRLKVSINIPFKTYLWETVIGGKDHTRLVMIDKQENQMLQEKELQDYIQKTQQK